MTDLEQKVAAVIDPAHSSMTPEHYGFQTAEEFQGTMAYGAQLVALRKARDIIAICAEEMAQLVERAFKDGLWIGENVSTTPDLAWETSKVRADLAAIRAMGKGERA